MLMLALAALVLWLVMLALPWRPWGCTERLQAEAADAGPVHDVTVLIPARDEAAVIGETLHALATAAPDVPVVLVDDQSTDGTVAKVRGCGLRHLEVLPGTPPPEGWTGKLWALEQGLAQVATPWVLLLDADIRLAPGIVPAMLRKTAEGYALVSLCAEPCWKTVVARWLMPAFVYFFKLLYPFALVGRGRSRVAAAAGGVILVRRDALADAGGFSTWRDAIIDDCTLAAHVKRAGHRCFLGLTRDATSLRRAGLVDIVRMVARTAFVQLRESWLALGTVSLLLVLAFWVPVLAVCFGDGPGRVVGALAWLVLAACYVPTLHYYRRNLLAALTLPLVATLFLAATWYSAARALAGTRSRWKGRSYRRETD